MIACNLLPRQTSPLHLIFLTPHISPTGAHHLLHSLLNLLFSLTTYLHTISPCYLFSTIYLPDTPSLHFTLFPCNLIHLSTCSPYPVLGPHYWMSLCDLSICPHYIFTILSLTLLSFSLPSLSLSPLSSLSLPIPPLCSPL